MQYIILCIGVLCAVIAQIALKVMAVYPIFEKKWIISLAVSILMYGMAFLTQVYLYRVFQLHKISTVMSIAIMLLVVLSGVAFFNETLQLKQIVGVIFGVISILLILT